MTVSFDVTAPQRAQITRIAKRWMAMLRASGMRPSYDIIDVRMTVSAVVAQKQVPLDLDALEQSNEFDFLHDMSGMHRHMDRTTGLLRDCFLPRAARGRKVAS